MLKKLAIAFVVLILAAGGGIYYVKSNLDRYVREAVEKYGAAATQTDVKLKNVKIVLLSGEASVGGLSVGSPKGFSADKSIGLGEILVKLDANSVRGTGPIVIQDITIDKPDIMYEVNNSGDNNLQTIAKNAQDYANAMGGSPKKEAAAADVDTDKKPARKIIINSLTIREGHIGISQALLKGKALSATLPTIHLTNIGKGNGGASPAEVAEQLLTVITSEATKIASADLAKELSGQAMDAAKGAVGSATDAVGGQIKGLFGK